MWLLPTYYRPEQVQLTLDSIQKAGCHSEGVVFIDGSDHPGYEQLKLPEKWSVIREKENRGVCGVLNHFFARHPNLPWYGLITDDSIVKTPSWDRILVDQATPYHIVHSADGWQAGQRIHGAVIFGGELLRALGWWAPPGLVHSYCDDAWEAIARKTGLKKFVPEVMVEHLHMWNGKAPVDRSYMKAYQTFDQDALAYARWEKEELPNAIARLKRFI
jgi:hypothetical protein